MKQNKKTDVRIPVIGLTGGAGCGKTYISELIGGLCRVYQINTDRIAEMQMKRGGVTYSAVVKLFGTEILDEKGEIDRKRLGGFIFDCPKQVNELNQITHPPVNDEVLKQIMLVNSKKEYDMILIESALLIEAGYESICDEIWYVYATKKQRAERLTRTRGYSDEKIKALMKCQNTDTFFRKHSDAIIKNNGDNPEKSILRLLRKTDILHR